MSEWTGKGDWSRVKNYNAFRDNYDNAFKRRKCLFLDDQRDVKDAYLEDDGKTLEGASGISKDRWHIVRNYREFVDWIEKNGIPDVVSFDVDLCEDHMRYYMTRLDLTDNWWNYKSFKVKCGIHCAEYLLELCKLSEKPFPKWFTHSANHFGREYLRKILPPQE
jgi:hypothetical protein